MKTTNMKLMSNKYKISDNDKACFVTITTVSWMMYLQGAKINKIWLEM